MLGRLLVEVFSPIMNWKKKKKIFDIKCHDFYLMKCLQIILAKMINTLTPVLNTSSF